MPRSALSKQLKHNITQYCAWRTMTDQKRLLLGSYGGPTVAAEGRSHSTGLHPPDNFQNPAPSERREPDDRQHNSAGHCTPHTAGFIPGWIFISSPWLGRRDFSDFKLT